MLQSLKVEGEDDDGRRLPLSFVRCGTSTRHSTTSTRRGPTRSVVSIGEPYWKIANYWYFSAQWHSMVDFKDRDLVLNYNDAVIYGSDLALVQSRTAWLNDACINFFFELIKHRLDKSARIQFMDPSVVSFFVHQCIDEEEIKDFVDGVSFPVTGKIFIPVNDTMVQSTAWHTRGGSHWSLMLVVKSNSEVQFWHFDSMGNRGNKRAAEDIATKIGANCFDMALPTVIPAATPPQSNGYDCGIHMLAAVQIFATMEEMDLKSHETRLRQEIQDNPNFCTNLRREITSEILRLHGDDSL